MSLSTFYILMTPRFISSSKLHMVISKSLLNISTWMDHRHLIFKMSKTELSISNSHCPTDHQHQSVFPAVFSISLKGMSKSTLTGGGASHLGNILDSPLRHYVQSTGKSYLPSLQNTSAEHCSLPTLLTTPVRDTMISHLDFCNGLLTSLSALTLNCLQSILHPTVLLKYIRSCHSSCSTTSKGLPSYSEQPLHQHVRPCRTWILALLSFLPIPPPPSLYSSQTGLLGAPQTLS